MGPDDTPTVPQHPSRRTWLLAAFGTIAGLAARSPLADEPPPDDPGVEARRRKAGLGPFGRTETEHYLGVGDSGEDYRAEALGVCEAMAKDLFAHLKERGLTALAWPKFKLRVVILSSPKAYAKYSGIEPNGAVGGHFDLDANCLVVFDARGDRAAFNAEAERVNTFTLIHEATHQLTFNAGLLDLKGDVPLCVSEGLAAYGEVWRPKGRGKVGQVNRPRLKGLTDGRLKGEPWLPLARLLVDDELFRAQATQANAYAQAWGLIHSHLKDPKKVPRLLAYLDAIRPRRSPASRLDDARAHLGDLDTLDADLGRYVNRPIGF